MINILYDVLWKMNKANRLGLCLQLVSSKAHPDIRALAQIVYLRGDPRKHLLGERGPEGRAGSEPVRACELPP
jgi:hypothetical protein